MYLSPSTGKPISSANILPYTIDEARQCFVVPGSFTAYNTNIFELKFHVDLPFFKFEVYSYLVATHQLTFSNKKRFYAVNGRLADDGNQTLDAVYDVAVVASVSFARLKDWTYTTRYEIASDNDDTRYSGYNYNSTMNHNAITASTTDSHLVMRFPQVEDCYDITAMITARDIPARLFGRFCTKLGINVSMEVVEGVKLSEPTPWHITVSEFGNKSCITIDAGDGNQYVTHLPNITTQEQNDNCLEWGVTLLSNVTYIPLVQIFQGGKGEWTAIIMHTYTMAADYKVELKAINFIHNQKNIFSVSVLAIDCNSPVLEMLGIYYHVNRWCLFLRIVRLSQRV